jgi:legumain
MEASVCHAYQLVKRHGIPDERIIVMRRNLIANDTDNPFPGQIFSWNGGPDVNCGCPLDYQHDDVTPDNFLKILEGDSDLKIGTGSGKVLKSGPKDNVFIYFMDHGTPGVIYFNDAPLTALRLINAITMMRQEGRYGKLFFIIDACHSGSMFRGYLHPHLHGHAYAITSAEADVNAITCEYNKTLDTNIASYMSSKWLYFADTEDYEHQTLEAMYLRVYEQMIQHSSHEMPFNPQQYGDMELGRHATLKDFFGPARSKPWVYPRKNWECNLQSQTRRSSSLCDYDFGVSDQDREVIDGFFEELIDELIADRSDDVKPALVEEIMTTQPMEIMDLYCHSDAVHTLNEQCFPFKKYRYAIKKVGILENICRFSGRRTAEILTTMKRLCQK